MSAITIRFPDSLSKGMKQYALADGYSINSFVISAVAEKLSAFRTEEQITEEQKRKARARMLGILARAPDVPPEPGDELPPGYEHKLPRHGLGGKARRARQSRSLQRRAG